MYTLYTFAMSGTAFRARIALNLKAIKPNYKFVHLFNHEQNSQTYTKINPNKGIPTLILPNGQSITESVAIVQYLNEKYPQPNNLYPGDALNRAKIRSFCEIINSGIHPYQNLRAVEKIVQDYKGDPKEWRVYWVGRGLDVLQKTINQTKERKFCLGEQVTAADVFLYPQVYSAIHRFKMDVSKYQQVNRIYNNLSQEKSFVEAFPQNQPDYEKP